MAVAVPLGIGAGLRQGEASGLTVDRVDFLRRTLRVDRQLVSRHVSQPVLAPPKTESSHRTIPLAGFLLEALADHLRRFPAAPGELLLRSPADLPLDSDRSATSGAARVGTLAYRASATTLCGTPSPRRCYPGGCR